MGYKSTKLEEARREAYKANEKLKEERRMERSMSSFGNKQHLGLFVAGALAGAVLKSKPMRSILVNVVATGMKVEKEAVAQINIIKEEANDIIYDAQQKNNQQ